MGGGGGPTKLWGVSHGLDWRSALPQGPWSKSDENKMAANRARNRAASIAEIQGNQDLSDDEKQRLIAGLDSVGYVSQSGNATIADVSAKSVANREMVSQQYQSLVQNVNTRLQQGKLLSALGNVAARGSLPNVNTAPTPAMVSPRMVRR